MKERGRYVSNSPAYVLHHSTRACISLSIKGKSSSLGCRSLEKVQLFEFMAYHLHSRVPHLLQSRWLATYVIISLDARASATLSVSF